VGLLGNTVLLASDGTRAVSAVAVAVLVLITRRDGLAPRGTALEVDVVNVGSGVDNVDIDTLTAVGRVEVLVECAEGQAVAVRDTSETPRSALLDGGVLGLCECVHDLVLLDEGNLRNDMSVKLYWAQSGQVGVGSSLEIATELAQTVRKQVWPGFRAVSCEAEED